MVEVKGHSEGKCNLVYFWRAIGSFYQNFKVKHVCAQRVQF